MLHDCRPGWDYLIVNRGRQPFDDWITLGTSAASAVWMDPMTGQIGLAALRDDAENTQVYLQLQPGQSLHPPHLRPAPMPMWPPGPIGSREVSRSS